jgi:uncharacterized protein
MMTNPTLMILDGTFAIHRFAPGTSIPKAVFTSPLFAITRTDEELSVVVLDGLPMKSEKVDSGWSVIKVNGPLKLNQVGVMAGLSTALAGAGVSLFALSTFDTDYLLVKVTALDKARDALEAKGYRFRKPRKQTGTVEKTDHSLLENQIPLVKHLLIEKIGQTAIATLTSDAAWSVTLGSVYEFLPTSVRLIIPRDTFINFFLRNKDKIMPAASDAASRAIRSHKSSY